MAEENEKKDSSAVGKINSAYNSYKNAKKIYNVAKAARTGMVAAEGVGAAAATSEVWVPVVVIGLIIVVIIIVLFGGVAGVKGGTPSPSSSPGTKPTMEEFLTLFKIKSCNNTDQYNYNCPDASTYEKTFLYNILSIPLQSATYKKLLTGDGLITIYLRPPLSSGSTTGGAEYGKSIIQYWGYLQSGLNQTTVKVSTIHETGHIIRNRNPDLNNSYKIKDLASKDSHCYESGSDGPYIKTYAYRSPAIGGGSLSESLAESIGMQTICGIGITCSKGVGASRPITSWPTYCPNTYDWIRTNIFGGDDFFVNKPPTQASPTSFPTTNTSPNKNTCNGRYDKVFYRSISVRKNYQYVSTPNFGDPNCTMTTVKDRDNLYKLILQLEPNKTRANSLFTCVIKWESSYNANNYAGSSASGNGAYGLFQMNPKSAGRKYDVGDVVWEQQVRNAINHIRPYSSLKAYWGAARAHNCPG